MAERLRKRVATELKTTFASSFSLAEALQLDAIAGYGKRATGEKYLINPSKGMGADRVS